VNLNHSSSDSDKKIHQGWGGDEGGTELKAEEAGKTDAQAEGDTTATDGWDAVPIDPWSAPPSSDPWGAPPEGDSIPAVEDEKAEDDRKPRERELEDEDSTISYDQYLSQLRETTTTLVPKLEDIREANEGAENTWGDVVEHKRNEDEQAYYVGKVWRRVLDRLSPPNIQYSSPRPQTRHAPKRKRKSTSRSTLTSIGPAVEGVVAVIVDVVAAIVASGDAVAPTVHSRL